MKKNNLWMKLKAGGLALAVIGAGIFGGLDAEKVKAADQPALTVDLSKETGDIIHGAAGFLYGISSEDVPTTNTLVPLKPKVLCTKGALGTEHPYGDALDVAKTFLESGGEQVMMYNSNYYGVFGVTANYRDYAEVLKETIAPAVVEWKKQWNEEHAKDNLRDVDIDKALVYIPINEGTPKNGTNFNEAWKAYYDAIREADPNACIAGPNSAAYNTQFGSNITMKSHMQYCIDHDCLPDIVTWHDLQVDKLHRLKSEMDDFRDIWKKADWSSYLAKHPELDGKRPEIPQICINEYADFADCGVPGRLVNWIARLEDQKIYGCLPFWHQANNLNDLTADANEGNGAWWLYKWYGDMSGKTVSVSTSTSYEKLYGVAAIDDTKKIATTLFGGIDGTANVNVLNVDKTGAFQGAEKVHVKIESTAFSGSHGAKNKVPVILEGTFPVNSDGSVTVPMNNMKFSTAYNLTITEAGENDKIADPLVNNYQKVYEAEQAAGNSECSVRVEGDYNPRYYLSDGQIVGMPRGAEMTYTIQVPSDGKYQLDFIYGNGTGTTRNNMATHNPQNIMQKYSIDGQKEKNVTMENTLLENMTGIKTLYADLTAGEHTVKILTTGEGVVAHDALTVTWSGAKDQDVSKLNNRYEAEQADFNRLLGKKDTAVKTETALGGYSSNGYVTGLEKRKVMEGGGIRWNVVVKEGGLYNVTLRYHTGETGVFQIYQGNTAARLDKIVKTVGVSAADTWQETTVTMYFQKGINIVDIDASMDSALDYMQIQEIPKENKEGLDISIEAESCVTEGSGIEVGESTGASGGKYVVGMPGAEDAENQKDKCLTFTFDAPAAGTYQMQIFQSNNDICGEHSYNTKIIDKYASVKVNGQPAKRYFFINTFSDDTFREKTVTVELKKGANEIKIFNDDSWHVLWGGTQSAPGTNKLVNYAPNFDKFVFTPLSLEKAIDMPEEYNIQVQMTAGGSVTADQNAVKAGENYHVTITPQRDLGRVLVNGTDRTRSVKMLEDGKYQLTVTNVQEDQLVQVYFEEGNTEYRDEYIKNAGFGTGSIQDWTAENVRTGKGAADSYEGYYALMEKDGRISQKVRLDAGYYKLDVLSKGKGAKGSAVLSVEELEDARSQISMDENEYEKTEISLYLKNYREITIKVDASELTEGQIYLDNFSLEKLDGRQEGQISKEYEYFVDCGDHNPDTLSEGVQFGKRNYVTDQLYGKDLRTGYLWGVVTSDTDTAVSAPAGSNGAYTVYQWANENNLSDNRPMTATFRYARNQTENGINPRYVKYRFQAEPGIYEVTAGMGNAWNNSGNPDVYAGTEGDKEKDTKLNAEPLKIGNGRNAKVTGTVTVGDGKNSLEVYALSSDATINMNYIQIRKIPGGADKTLQSIEVTAPDKTLYDLDEELDTAGMTVTAVYDNGSKEPVSLNDCTIGTMDGSTEGQKTIEVSYTMGETTVRGTFTALVKKLTEKDLYYFTDCGDHNPDKATGEDQMGKYNSVTDQVYGVDAKAGKSWGVVTSEKDVKIETPDQNSKGAFTTYQRANTNKGDVADDQAKTTSFRYAHGQDTAGFATRYVRYCYELDPGTYRVTAGMGNAWGNSANPNVYAGISNDSIQDTKLNDTPLNISKGKNKEVSKDVTVPEGSDKMYVYALSSDATINMNYVLIQHISDVKVSPLSLEITDPGRKEYGLGDELDLAGMKVTVVYSENEKRNIGTSQCRITGFDSETAGDKTVTVSFTENGKTVSETFTVSVKNSLRITAKDGIVGFGEDLSKYTQEQLKAVFQTALEYGEGYTAEYDYSDVDTHISGIYDVVIRAVKDGKAAKEIAVKLTVKADTAKLQAKINEARALNEANYTADSYQTLTSAIADAQKILDSSDYVPQADVDKKAEALEKAVGRLQKNVKSISVSQNPDKVVYQKGEFLNLEGLKVTVVYSDHSESIIDREYVEVNGYNAVSTGKQTITVAYEGKTAKFEVTVEEPVLTSVEVVKGPDKTEYVQGEELDLTGLKVRALYHTGEKKEIAAANCQITGFDKNTVGEQTVTVSFTENGKTASDTFVVSVKKKSESLNKNALKEVINRTENLNKSDYTEVSWAALEKALAAANKAMESDTVTQEEVDAAAIALRDAIAGLQRADKRGLDDAIRRAGERKEADYTRISWAEMQKALTAAKKVTENADATQKEVDAAALQLNEALRNLEERKAVKKDALGAAIARTANLKETDYTISSWRVLQDALAKANQAAADEAAAQTEVNEATDALRDALAALNRVDRSGLKAAIDRAYARKEENYPDKKDEWKAMQDALAAAEEMMKNTDAAQVDVDEATRQLSEALRHLDPEGTINKNALSVVIERANGLKGSDYPSSSWSQMQEVLAEANQIMESVTATQEDVNEAAVSLRRALNLLEQTRIDKSGLKAAIERAGEKKETDYPGKADEWKTMQDALADARTVEENADATQIEIDVATRQLSEAIRQLDAEKTVNKNALIAAIARTQDMKETDYTASSWKAFQRALEAANQAVTSDTVTQDEVNAATAALREALEKLSRADKSGLNAAIDRANERKEAEYTAESWTVMQEALAAVKKVAENADATQSEIDEATYQLSYALRKLVKKTVNKDALLKKYNEAKAIKADGYTAESFASLTKAIAEAGKVLDNETATQAEADAQVKALEAAVAGLKKAGGSGNKEIKVSQIKITGPSKKIAAGKKVQLKAVISPANAANKQVIWKSGNTKIATVDSKGVVRIKARTGGKSVTITATAADGSGRKAVFKIRSMKGAVKKITISGKKSVKAGKKLQLKAKVSAAKKANKKLKWTCSNTKYAKVNSKGKVTALKAGKGRKVKITAAATDGSGKKKTITVTIK